MAASLGTVDKKTGEVYDVIENHIHRHPTLDPNGSHAPPPPSELPELSNEVTAGIDTVIRDVVAVTNTIDDALHGHFPHLQNVFHNHHMGGDDWCHSRTGMTWGVDHLKCPDAHYLDGIGGPVRMHPPRVPPLISRSRSVFDLIFGTQLAHALSVLCDDCPSDKTADVANFVQLQNTLAVALSLFFGAGFGGIFGFDPESFGISQMLYYNLLYFDCCATTIGASIACLNVMALSQVDTEREGLLMMKKLMFTTARTPLTTLIWGMIAGMMATVAYAYQVFQLPDIEEDNPSSVRITGFVLIAVQSTATVAFMLLRGAWFLATMYEIKRKVKLSNPDVIADLKAAGVSDLPDATFYRAHMEFAEAEAMYIKYKEHVGASHVYEEGFSRFCCAPPCLDPTTSGLLPRPAQAWVPLAAITAQRELTRSRPTLRRPLHDRVATRRLRDRGSCPVRRPDAAQHQPHLGARGAARGAREPQLGGRAAGRDGRRDGRLRVRIDTVCITPTASHRLLHTVSRVDPPHTCLPGCSGPRAAVARLRVRAGHGGGH